MALASLSQKGFTLIELIVTVSVFVLLSVSLLGNYRATTRSLSLNTLAGIVASDIRQAQAFEIGGVAGVTTNDTDPSGISFTSAFNTSYQLFTDSLNPTTYNYQNDNAASASCSGECRERMIIRGGSKVSKLCVNMKRNGLTPATCTSLQKLHITFKRPDPEPLRFTADNGTITWMGHDAEIILASEDGTLTKVVTVWSTGLVTVE